MGERYPLKKGAKITMPNHGKYIIDSMIGQGGLALIYTAETAQNGYPVIVKEFFPCKGAERAMSSGENRKKGQVYAVPGNEHRFQACKDAFQKEGRLGSVARSANYQILPFADCGDGYAILPRWSEDTCSFSELVRYWRKTPPVQIDPVFRDLGRLRFALIAVSSLLSALSVVHGQSMLHLDITADNVVWCGNDRRTAKNGVSFLTDFGCAVLMKEGAFAVEDVLSYSTGYAAPEYQKGGGFLTPATDLYAVGCVLTYLCFGDRCFRYSEPEDLIHRMKVPQRIRDKLSFLVRKALCHHPEERYQTAHEMQDAVEELIALIPLKPINPDVTRDFTLYSLKNMLLGSPDIQSSWAAELCDRRGVPLETLPDNVCLQLTPRKFIDDQDFLIQVLPHTHFRYIKDRIEDGSTTMREILSGNYDCSLKDDLVKICRRDTSRALLGCAKGILEDCRNHFDAVNRGLRQILAKDGERYLLDCQNRCETARNPEFGLAMLILYALLGPEYFKRLIESPGKAKEYFN